MSVCEFSLRTRCRRGFSVCLVSFASFACIPTWYAQPDIGSLPPGWRKKTSSLTDANENALMRPTD